MADCTTSPTSRFDVGQLGFSNHTESPGDMKPGQAHRGRASGRSGPRRGQVTSSTRRNLGLHGTRGTIVGRVFTRRLTSSARIISPGPHLAERAAWYGWIPAEQVYHSTSWEVRPFTNPTSVTTYRQGPVKTPRASGAGSYSMGGSCMERFPSADMFGGVPGRSSGPAGGTGEASTGAFPVLEHPPHGPRRGARIYDLAYSKCMTGCGRARVMWSQNLQRGPGCGRLGRAICLCPGAPQHQGVNEDDLEGGYQTDEGVSSQGSFSYFYGGCPTLARPRHARNFRMNQDNCYLGAGYQ